MIIQPMPVLTDAQPSSPPVLVPTAQQGVALLSHLGVIRAQGADAASFLQGQLTQDVLTLPPGQACLAAFCSAKGRMQASFWVVRPKLLQVIAGTAEAQVAPVPEFWLVCSQDILAATLKRLSMFVLRAKVKLSDASSEFKILGLIGENASNLVAIYANSTMAKGQFDEINTVPLPPAGEIQRAMALWPQEESDATVQATADTAPKLPLPSVPLPMWLLGEVQSGVATITRPIVDAFVPQMLNYESVGGVSFKKGCYPGQEVVARSQFRGTLKRRAYIVRGEAPMTAGDEVFSATDPGQPCGRVAQAASVPGSSAYLAIVSMQVAAAQAATESAASLCLKSAQGPHLTLLDLPYVLLDDI
jgi:folate-binding protein YgfZ